MALAQYVAHATQSFTLPDICIRIRGVLDDHRSDVDDIARLISVDPSLTAKILRLSNSALFRFPSQITSISKAVNVIGGEALYNLVIAETANVAFKHFDTDAIQLDKHWQQSVYCGMVGKYIARQLNIRGSERFFVMGILLNLSELVIAKHAKEHYLEYVAALPDGMPWDIQQHEFGFDFAACSGTIMEQWNLPSTLFFPVKNLHWAGKQADEADIAVLALAQRITLKKCQAEIYDEIEVVTESIRQAIDVDDELIEGAMEHADKETAKVASSIQ